MADDQERQVFGGAKVDANGDDEVFGHADVRDFGGRGEGRIYGGGFSGHGGRSGGSEPGPDLTSVSAAAAAAAVSSLRPCARESGRG